MIKIRSINGQFSSFINERGEFMKRMRKYANYPRYFPVVVKCGSEEEQRKFELKQQKKKAGEEPWNTKK